MLASDWQYHDILDISPYEGGQPPNPTPTPELKFLI